MTLSLAKQFSRHKRPLGLVLPVTVPALIAFLFLSACFYRLTYSRVKGTSTTMTASEIISVANAARLSDHLLPLHPQDQLMHAAESKARAMLASDVWSHDMPSETPWQFIDTEGYVYIIAGENLAKDYDKPEHVVQAWLDSPTHRANLLNPEYTETGVAVVEGPYQKKEDTTLVVQYLARPYQSGDPQPVKTNFTLTPLITKTSPLARSLVVLSTFLVLCISVAGSVVYRLLHAKKDKGFTPSLKHWKKM